MCFIYACYAIVDMPVHAIMFASCMKTHVYANVRTLRNKHTHTKITRGESAESPRDPRSLERNKRWCNKRGCKSKKYGNMQNLPNLREFGRICAKFARKLRSFSKITQICAKFTAPFVTVPFVPVRAGGLRHGEGADHLADLAEPKGGFPRP